MNLQFVANMEAQTGLHLAVDKVPRHIAVVMDGNGRWAKERGLDRSAGHRAGVDALDKTVLACRRLGVKYLTVYAFSTENWNRPLAEVGTLMSLLSEFAVSKLTRLKENRVEVRVLGDLEGLPLLQRTALKQLMNVTAAARLIKAAGDADDDEGMVLNLALNYGGRAEILQGVKRAAAELSAEELQQLTEADFSRYLHSGEQPDPDLLIRTSGELRLSNFLLCSWLMPSFILPMFCGRILMRQSFSARCVNISRGRGALAACRRRSRAEK